MVDKSPVLGLGFGLVGLNHGYMCNFLHAISCMQLYSTRRPSGAKIIACNKLRATNCIQQIACNYFRIWALISLSFSVCLLTSYPKCRLTKSYCYYHVIPPNAVIVCNTLAVRIFSNTFESLQLLQLLHATIAERCMQ